jgi:hypothetical protein
MPKHRVDHKKISGNHTTLIAAAVPLIKAIILLPCVRRVAPGFIRGGLRNLQTYKARIKLSIEPSGVKLMVRAQSTVQEIYIYSNDRDALVTHIIQAATAARYHIQTARDEHRQ